MSTTRRGFLGGMLKGILGAAVAPTILPTAAFYVRKWGRPAESRIFRPSDYWNGESLDQFHKLPFYLAKQEAKLFPTYPSWSAMLEAVTWNQNLGDTMRGIIIKP